jgi:hypothetical protein
MATSFRRILGRSSITILWFSSVLLLNLAASSPVRAESDEQIKAAIEDVLSQRHPRDTPTWWRGLGENAPRIMIQLYQNSAKIYHRVRLLEALGHFDQSKEALDFLKQESQETTDDVLRNTAVLAVGRAAGEKELEFVEEFLTHKDPHTRYAAARAFQLMKGTRARDILTKYRTTEKTSWIIAKLDDSPLRGVSLLQPVASNADATKSPLLGKWEGIWIAPSIKPVGWNRKWETPYLVSEVRLSAEAKNGRVEAELEIVKPAEQLEATKKKALKGMKIPLKTLETLENKVYASIAANPFSNGNDSTGAAWEFRGDIQDVAGFRQIEIGLSKSGSRWLLRAAQ